MGKELSDEINKDFKKFIKNLKKFRKVNTQDFDEGERQANSLILEITSLQNKLEEVSVNEKHKKLKKVSDELDRSYDVIELYLKNVGSLKEFKQKWGNNK